MLVEDDGHGFQYQGFYSTPALKRAVRQLQLNLWAGLTVCTRGDLGDQARHDDMCYWVEVAIANVLLLNSLRKLGVLMFTSEFDFSGWQSSFHSRF